MTDQLSILADIFSNTERPDNVSVRLCKITRDLVIQYEDLDDEWFKELSATIDPSAPCPDQQEPVTIKQAQAILDAYSTLADLRDRSVSESEMLAAALREAINQCQNGQGMIPAPELLRIATRLDVVEDDIDLFQAQ